MSLPSIAGEFRVVADPEIRFSPSGTAVSRVRLVASSRKQDQDGTWRDANTFWVSATAFKSVAENMVESIKKGDLVTVVGRMETQEWEADGQKRSAPALLIDSIGPSMMFRNTPHGAAQGAQGASQAPQQANPPQQAQQAAQQPPAQPQQAQQGGWDPSAPPF